MLPSAITLCLFAADVLNSLPELPAYAFLVGLAALVDVADDGEVAWLAAAMLRTSSSFMRA